MAHGFMSFKTLITLLATGTPQSVATRTDMGNGAGRPDRGYETLRITIGSIQQCSIVDCQTEVEVFRKLTRGAVQLDVHVLATQGAGVAKAVPRRQRQPGRLPHHEALQRLAIQATPATSRIPSYSSYSAVSSRHGQADINAARGHVPL